VVQPLQDGDLAKNAVMKVGTRDDLHCNFHPSQPMRSKPNGPTAARPKHGPKNVVANRDFGHLKMLMRPIMRLNFLWFRRYFSDAYLVLQWTQT
jgi:hypothetical protein